MTHRGHICEKWDTQYDTCNNCMINTNLNIKNEKYLTLNISKSINMIFITMFTWKN